MWNLFLFIPGINEIFKKFYLIVKLANYFKLEVKITHYLYNTWHIIIVLKY